MRVLNTPLVLVEQQLVQRAVATAVFEQLKSWAQHFRAAQAVQIAQQHWLHAPICFKAVPEGWNLVSLPPPGGFILEFWNLTSCSITKFKSIASDWRPNHMSVKHWGTAVLCVFIIYCCIGVCCRNRSQKRNQHSKRRCMGCALGLPARCPVKGHAISLFCVWWMSAGSGGKMVGV